jgi:hypothetical protein
MSSGSEFAQNSTKIEKFDTFNDLVNLNTSVQTSAAIPRNARTGTT